MAKVAYPMIGDVFLFVGTRRRILWFSSRTPELIETRRKKKNSDETFSLLIIYFA